MRKLTRKIAELLSSPSPPDLVLNRHCAACEFQIRCREKAIEKDDLSLLPRMTEKERRKFHSKGIFSVTQLSYTFRPRRKPKRLAQKRAKYHHALKALAIRERKIHIVDSPDLKLEGTPVYLDVEGLPDRDFYYLIGVRFKTAQKIVQHSLWADSVDEERRIWSDFLEVLSGLDNPVLIHYGSYETTFLKRMCERHGEPAKNLGAATAVASPLNLLSVIFASIYFPSHSNGLKDCAKSLGFKWSAPNVSGAMAVIWRLQWEKSRHPTVKEALIEYNAEDCEGLRLLTEFLSSLSTSTAVPTDGDRDLVVNVESLPRNSLFKFQKVQFQVPNSKRSTKPPIGITSGKESWLDRVSGSGKSHRKLKNRGGPSSAQTKSLRGLRLYAVPSVAAQKSTSTESAAKPCLTSSSASMESKDGSRDISSTSIGARNVGRSFGIMTTLGPTKNSARISVLSPYTRTLDLGYH